MFYNKLVKQLVKWNGKTIDVFRWLQEHHQQRDELSWCKDVNHARKQTRRLQTETELDLTTLRFDFGSYRTGGAFILQAYQVLWCMNAFVVLRRDCWKQRRVTNIHGKTWKKQASLHQNLQKRRMRSVKSSAYTDADFRSTLLFWVFTVFSWRKIKNVLFVFDGPCFSDTFNLLSCERDVSTVLICSGRCVWFQADHTGLIRWLTVLSVRCDNLKSTHCYGAFSLGSAEKPHLIQLVQTTSTNRLTNLDLTRLSLN